MGKLTALAIKAETKPGRYTDGDGLHLHIRPSGSKGWVLRYMRRGKLRDMGLGGFPDVTLAEARVAARAARDHLDAGRDPILHRQRQGLEEAPERTFKAAAEKLLTSKEAGWRNAKHRWQWEASLESYAYPEFGDTHVQQVTTEMVLAALKPIWSTKTETAKRVRGQIEAVLDAAKALHWRQGENPARWKGHLALLLPRPSQVRAVAHHPSLPWRQVPVFLAALRQRAGSAALAIEWAILTAARSGEVRGMTRHELDLDAGLWSVPKERMKAGRPHRVPLSTAALAFLARHHVDELKPDDLVFPGQKAGLSDMALTAAVRRMNSVEEGQPAPWVDPASGQPIVPHGFRSSFRVWAGEETEFPREVIEAALAHQVENAVERAYQRSDLLDRRRPLMEEWGRWCGVR